MSVLSKSVGGRDYPANDFAYVGDPQDISTWHLLVADTGHARDALGRFDQAQMPDAAKRRGAFHAVLAACKKFGIDASGFEKAHQATMSEVDSSGPQDQAGCWSAGETASTLPEHITAAAQHSQLAKRHAAAGNKTAANAHDEAAGAHLAAADALATGNPKATFASTRANVMSESANQASGTARVKLAMMAASDQWLEIFRAGNYGEKGNYTHADLDRVIAEYDPARHEAPLVVGHPEHDAPAFGWVAKLRRVGAVLQALPRQVHEGFRQMVREGRFKKRSVAFYRDPGGKLLLRHIGFLGAQPPEVKGLADARFGEQRFESIEFATNEDAPAGVDPASVELRDAARERVRQSAGSLTFGEALRLLRSEGWQPPSGAVQVFAERTGAVDPASVELRDAARERVRQSAGGITFGEALRLLRSEGWQPTSEAVQVFAERTVVDPASVELRDAARDRVRQSSGTLAFGEALQQLRSEGRG